MNSSPLSMREGIYSRSSRHVWWTVLALTFLIRHSYGVQKQEVIWTGQLVAIEHTMIPREARRPAPEIYGDAHGPVFAGLVGGYCLLDGSPLDESDEAIGTIPINGTLPANEKREDYRPKDWSQLSCSGDQESVTWEFEGVAGSRNDDLKNGWEGTAVHDYAIGTLRNNRTGRCATVVREDYMGNDDNIEGAPHAIRSRICAQDRAQMTDLDVDMDEVYEEHELQLWIIYFTPEDQPFGPLVPAKYSGICLVEDQDARDVAVAEFSQLANLRQVDMRYVALSTVDGDDGGGVSPMVKCTGQKWVMQPPFLKREVAVPIPG